MESNESLASSKAATKRTANEYPTEPQEETAKSDHEDNALSEFCDNIDFKALFTSEREPTELCLLAHVFSCASCPLCNYVANLIQHRPFHIPIELSQGKLELSSRCLLIDEYLHASWRDLFYRVTISLTNNHSHHTRLSTLEICEGLSEFRARNSRIFRVPLKENFDLGLLQRWLENSEILNDKRERLSKKRQSAATASISTSIEDLICIKKFRVLDVLNGDVLVLESAKRYIALSYVWGHVKNHNDISMNPSILDQKPTILCHINIDTQPTTIKDAAYLVCRLGERYLWVDSLCINQNNPKDVAKVVSNMDAIYRSAYFTIVAADGEDANAGLQRLHPRQADCE